MPLRSTDILAFPGTWRPTFLRSTRLTRILRLTPVCSRRFDSADLILPVCYSPLGQLQHQRLVAFHDRLSPLNLRFSAGRQHHLLHFSG